MNKRIIIIGNKVINKDISSFINNFDIIVRINKMNNIPFTGDKTNIWFLDYNQDFLTEQNKNLRTTCFNVLKKYIPLVIIPHKWKYDGFLDQYKEYKDNTKLLDIYSLLCPENSFSIYKAISYIFTNEKYNDYEKYLICHDLNRYELLGGNNWGYHKNSKDGAELFLNNLIETKQLKYIDADKDDLNNYIFC